MTPNPSSLFVIVGYGSIGRRHLSIMREAMPLARIIVARRGAQPLDAEQAGMAQVVGSLAEALAETPVAVVLCSPAPCHAAQGLACVAAGVPLLVEKPLASDAAEAASLAAAARQAGVVLQIGYCLRFDPSLTAARQALLDGQIGRLLAIEVEVAQDLRDWRPGTDWRAGVSAQAALGGGALMELSHEIDIAGWLGGPVAAVTARLARTGLLDGSDVEDWVDLLLEFRSGACARVHMDMIQQPPRRLCRMIGSEGTIEWDGIARQARLYRRSTAEWTVLPCGTIERNTLFRAQWTHFIDRIADGAPPLVSGEDGCRVMDIVTAARQSSQSGRRVVL
ncbi:MAG TPA: Gfo/Idh/MocA family oxidoreductase [Patescibacteria group bacterium]|nr:Gfo/Idh/MocA family oxidoreductase [Patescibacteria group bacterium]